MTAFSKNVRALLAKKELTQQKFADAIGVTQTTVSGWLNRAVQPKTTNLDVICDEFDLIYEDLLSETAGLYAKLHGLTSAPAGALAPATPRKAYAPLVGRVHAGDATEPDIIDYEIAVPYEVWENHQDGYFLEVEGTCMNRVYPEGCRVLIDPAKQPIDGSIAVVSIDGEYVMRRLHLGASVLLLSPESFDEHDDIIIRDGNVEFVGTVVWYQSAGELE